MISKSELDVQNFASDFYEECRYQNKNSRFYHDWWNKKMYSLFSRKGRILDNGCGTGILFEMFHEEKDNIVGIDISYNMLKYSKIKTNKLIMGDSQHLPFQNECFDLIIGRSLLHHLPKPIEGVKEMARVLKRGGEIVVVDTNYSLLSALPRYLAKKGGHFSDEHKNMRTSQIVKMIGDFFKVDRIYYFGYLAYPMGFPDIIDVGKHFPCALMKILIKLDSFISNIPIIRTQSWGIMIKGTLK